MNNVHASSKILWLFSMTNCTAMFFACMSVISRSMLRSRIIVGAKTTAKFLGDIYAACQLQRPVLGFDPLPSSRARAGQHETDGISGIRGSRCASGASTGTFCASDRIFPFRRQRLWKNMSAPTVNSPQHALVPLTIRFQNAFVYIKREKRSRQPPEVLLQDTGDCRDVQVGV